MPPFLLTFQFYSNPWTLLGPSRLLVLGELTFFTNLTFHSLSLLVLFTPNLHDKIAYYCIFFSFILYDNLFLFLTSLSNHSKPFLKFRPPVYSTPRLLTFGVFSDPHAYLDPRLFCTVEYQFFQYILRKNASIGTKELFQAASPLKFVFLHL